MWPKNQIILLLRSYILIRVFTNSGNSNDYCLCNSKFPLLFSNLVSNINRRINHGEGGNIEVHGTGDTK